MTDKEWIETLPNASNKELMESLDYFGYDSYYRTCREPLVAEITKRLNQLTEKDKQIGELEQTIKTLTRKFNQQSKLIEDYNTTLEKETKRIAELKKQLGNLYEIIKRPYQFTALTKIQMVKEVEQLLKEVEG